MKIVTYLCYHCITGKQDIPYTYIANTEEEAYEKFKANADVELEVNDIFINEITDEEAEEIFAKEIEWENEYESMLEKRNDMMTRYIIRRKFRHSIPKQQRKTMKVK